MLYMELLGTKATCMRHPDDIQAVFSGDPLLYSKAAPGLKRLSSWLGNGLVVNADVEHHATVCACKGDGLCQQWTGARDESGHRLAWRDARDTQCLVAGSVASEHTRMPCMHACMHAPCTMADVERTSQIEAAQLRLMHGCACSSCWLSMCYQLMRCHLMSPSDVEHVIPIHTNIHGVLLCYCIAGILGGTDMMSARPLPEAHRSHAGTPLTEVVHLLRCTT